MAGQYGRVNGVFNKVNKEFVKVNGMWQPVKKRYAKAGGVWQPTFTSGIPVRIMTSYYIDNNHPTVAVVNTSNANNFSFYGTLDSGSYRECSVAACAHIYFEPPNANACTVGSNIFSINGVLTRTQSGEFYSAGGDTQVLQALRGMKNQTQSLSGCGDLPYGYGGDNCLYGPRLVEEQSAGTTSYAINQIRTLAHRTSEAIVGFEITIGLSLNYHYHNCMYETVAVSIPWDAFTYLPTGEHLVYNP